VTTQLADLTTLHVGGPAACLIEATTDTELVEAVAAADAAGTPLLLVAGGSNLLVTDEGFDGTVVHIASQGISVASEDACGGGVVTVAAGHPFDDFVATAVDRGWAGVEALSGIPGSVGATPVQNVGAYGQEVGHTIETVRTWDRVERRQKTFVAAELGFGYRTSWLKSSRVALHGLHAESRYVVLDVTFQFPLRAAASEVVYPELARRLGVEVGARVPSAAVREAVLALRAAKGMVWDPADRSDHDTWSAGSFFTNPLLTADQADLLPAEAPRYPQGDGRVKTSAAWLIDHAGFGRGFGAPGPATLSTKHTLALTNRGDATAADLLALARTVADGVQARFGIQLVNEPVLVGASL
jgi:UDP-N-acetylmuramate dehydrogenase